ncbi:MAG: MBL fold metallo-hydrolase [Hydrogenobacter thermophilus]|uniref:Beta-lactamase-like protein n=1 Tax=Hydrogenobacter thermophilus (strain DSM 6534 / IAM 12695 / TK-6) TaxID=608538 RepID=D3DJG9_HYDTT|nr:MBL fold metallo-hydrolase [Hydrogenobacter thermophilus]ADO45894.1 beta lactamase precursor [Hydrogenobacter thermophilus TK-6]MCS7284520.1 MBL fold metallo-hydrolase [Hydrogenobacter thermophilus]BAI69971.1 beta-lactamase-like protein [Hydrogenobacter thermophilus TK-6]
MALLLSLILIFSFSFSQVSVRQTLKEIQPGIYGVFGTYEQVSKKNRGFISNAYFVVTKDGVIVFDALSTYRLGRELIESIRSITKKPIKYLVVSHYHTDHFYGAKALKDAGAILVAHPWSYEYLSGEESQRMFMARKELLGRELEGTKLLPPDITTSSSLTIHLGSEKFEVHHWCRAHTNGDIVMYMPSKRVLFAGDLVFGGRVPFLGSGNSKTWLECLDRIIQIKPQILLPGHGPYLRGEKEIEKQVMWTRQYIQDIRSVVKKLYEEGLSVEEVRNRANEEMLRINPEYAQVGAFFDVNPVNAYYVYFEVERELLENSR